MNFAKAAGEKMQKMKDATEKSLKLPILAKELVGLLPDLMSSLAEIAGAVGPLASGDASSAGDLKDATLKFKDVVEQLQDKINEIKKIVKDMQDLLGDDAKDGKLGKLITKFLNITEATMNVIVKCGNMIEILDQIIALVEGGSFDADKVKGLVGKVKEGGEDVKVAVGELKNAITGDGDDGKGESKKDKKKDNKVEGQPKGDAVTKQPKAKTDAAKVGKDKTKTKSSSADDDEGSCSCCSCLCCCCSD